MTNGVVTVSRGSGGARAEERGNAFAPGGHLLEAALWPGWVLFSTLRYL